MSSVNARPPDEPFHLKLRQYMESEFVYFEGDPLVFVPIGSLFATMISMPTTDLLVDLKDIPMMDGVLYKMHSVTVNYCLNKLCPLDMEKYDIDREIVHISNAPVILVFKASAVMHFILKTDRFISNDIIKDKLIDGRFYDIDNDSIFDGVKRMHTALDAPKKKPVVFDAPKKTPVVQTPDDVSSTATAHWGPKDNHMQGDPNRKPPPPDLVDAMVGRVERALEEDELGLCAECAEKKVNCVCTEE